MLTVGAGAVDHNVGLFGALAILGLAQQHAERLLSAFAVTGAIFFQETAPANLEHLAVGAQDITQLR